MIVPDCLIGLQLRNAAGVLEACTDDARLIPATRSALMGVAKSLRDTAKMIEGLPPFIPDERG